MIAASDEAETLKRSDEGKSILLRELAHGVANNFATVAALIRMKADSVSDARAKSVLDEAIEQVTVMGRVHRRLRSSDRGTSLDSESFIHELCEDLKAMMRGQPLSIECNADSCLMAMDQAVSLGLIVNELVTNAIKHAFPDGRAGRIRIKFEVLESQWRLSVEDDGNGFGRANGRGGQGQDLVRGLTSQLGADLECETTGTGTTFRLSIPLAGMQYPQPCAARIH